MCSSSFFKKKKVRLFWGFYISRAYSLLALFFENESVSWLHKYSIVCMNHNMFNYSPNVEYADWVLVINNSSKISSIGLIPYFSQPAYCSGSLSCVVNSMVLLHSDFQLVLANLGARQSDYVFPWLTPCFDWRSQPSSGGFFPGCLFSIALQPWNGTALWLQVPGG